METFFYRDLMRLEEIQTSPITADVFFDNSVAGVIECNIGDYNQAEKMCVCLCEY